jgi:hypothetical protein
MKSPIRRSIKIFSDGSLNFSLSNVEKLDQCFFYEKDIKTFHLNKKKLLYLARSESSSSYKKKYLI